MSTYSIKDIEKFTGIKAHTIRIWEKRYGVIDPERTDTNIRYYSDSDLKKLLNISILNRNGFKISDIVWMGEDELSEKVLQVTQRIYDADTQMEGLVVAMIELDELKFDKLLSSSIIKFGFEQAVLQVIYPFFERVGLLWQVGSITPAQEHFMSNLIRQKLLVAIDGLATGIANDSKTFLLFLPEGEWHEIGLLFSCYILRKRGYKVVYLGQSVPYDNLKEVVSLRNCNVLLTQFISAISDENLVEYIDRLSTDFADLSIFMGGYQFLDRSIETPKNVTVYNDMNEFKSLIFKG
ncbi:MAG: MerR family transcriptional regulator [Sphingobacteriia bacterium]|nr:MerR family transcriptional regulator [Sphingobacteriia bacterium]